MASNLFVNRLYVLTELNQVAYDEPFHHGVNIIRGDNSSGKSTIAHLLFYALGGEYTRFVDEARRCSRVLVEVSLGGAMVTLERALDKDSEGRVKPRQGMTIHWGTMPEALEGHCRRLVLGYAATQARQSFSSVLFRLMDMPAVQTDCALTMHQLLRLMYVDQESPTWSLFLHEQFDRQATREAVADLLMGIYDSRLYEARLALRQQEADIDEARALLRSLESVLPSGLRSRDSVGALIEQKQAQIDRYAQDIARMRAGETPAVASPPLVEEQKATVATLARECSRLEEQADLMEHEVQDTRFFIDELTSKRAWLLQSASTRRALGSMRLDFCPECLSPLPDQVPQGTCCLCKSRVEGEAGLTQARRLAEDFALQIQESGTALRASEEQLTSLKARLRASRRRHKAAQKALDELLGTARGSMAAQLEDLHYRRGCAQGELLQCYTLLEQAERYQDTAARLATLRESHARTDRLIQELISRQEQRRAQVLACMQRHGVYFLHHDKESQKAFSSARPEDFHVDFSDNRVYLQQPHDRFSASSSFFLKLVARFSLLFASLDLPWMRYPRFILADNMEDKGIEMVRAQKFQQTLISRLAQYPPDQYQVIYTTSYITPQLEQSPYVVGEHYAMGHKSLRNV